jgi:lysophospholipase L1-like esterase
MKSISWIYFLIFILTSFTCSGIHAQGNLSFNDGLTDWVQMGAPGNVKIENATPPDIGLIAKLGETYAGIATRRELNQFDIVQYNISVKTEGENLRAYTFLRFYNDSDKLLLEYRSKAVHSEKFTRSGTYTDAPASTRYMVFGVEKDSTNNGYVYAKDFSIEIDDTKPKSKPVCNLDQYMKPLWNTDTVFNETVLMYASLNDSIPGGKLLFHPKKILSVTNFSSETIYNEGADYTLENNEIRLTRGSKMPFSKEADFSKKNNAWFNVQGKWIVVTYTHNKNEWTAFKPLYKGNLLPNTIRKLKSKKPVRIAALGMSITRGQNASGYDNIKPYMPNYCDLLVRQLKLIYKYNKIDLFNAALPGAASGWAASFADKYINPLIPDLLILDMGMNDFWGTSVEDFRKNMQKAIDKVRTGNPDVEVMLISNMLFDPEYFTDGTADEHLNLMRGYRDALAAMEGKGIVNLDITAISETLFKLKKPKDCIANPLHPNDYMARWYAQGMVALLDPSAKKTK